MVLVFEVIGEVSLWHPRVIFKHVSGVLWYSECSNSMKGKHPHLPLSPLYIHLLNPKGFLRWEVHHWVFSALKEMIDHEVENVVVVIFLIHDLCGENLYYQANTHFPFYFTIKNT
jgi:hypothetical protein